MRLGAPAGSFVRRRRWYRPLPLWSLLAIRRCRRARLSCQECSGPTAPAAESRTRQRHALRACDSKPTRACRRCAPRHSEPLSRRPDPIERAGSGCGCRAGPIPFWAPPEFHSRCRRKPSFHLAAFGPTKPVLHSRSTCRGSARRTTSRIAKLDWMRATCGSLESCVLCTRSKSTRSRTSRINR